MRKTLVVYFSRTGYTQKAAESIAAGCGADVEGIREHRGRRGILGYFRSAREALKGVQADIQPVAKQPEDYEVVILGTPVWAGKISSPMRAYLVANRDKFDQVAFFCTQHASGAEKVFRDMAELCPQPALATLALNDADIRSGGHKDKVDRFVKDLRPGVRR